MRDTCTNQGAQELATTIRDYWHGRGYDVAVDVVPMTMGAGNFVVRSNLHNGWPQPAALDPETRARDPFRLAMAELLEGVASPS